MWIIRSGNFNLFKITLTESAKKSWSYPFKKIILLSYQIPMGHNEVHVQHWKHH